MPELPDVEFIKQRLERALVGAKIVAASSDGQTLRGRATGGLARALVGGEVRAVARRGKWLMVALDRGRLFSHLGMTGWWVVRDIDAATERFERARLDVARGRSRASLRYTDPRRFGRLVVANDEIAEWRELGPDPLADGIDVDRLADRARSTRAIKAVIMDQAVLAGIGNIIATEALWRVRIDPRAPARKLARAEIASLARAMKDEIRRELATRAKAKSDDWTDRLAIYGRAAEPCPRCGAVIASAVVGGRTSAYCPKCQTIGTRATRRGGQTGS